MSKAPLNPLLESGKAMSSKQTCQKSQRGQPDNEGINQISNEEAKELVKILSTTSLPRPHVYFVVLDQEAKENPDGAR